MVREARGVRAPLWRGARRPPRSSCRPCRSAASPSSTVQTPTSRCRPSRCRGTARSPAKGKILSMYTTPEYLAYLRATEHAYQTCATPSRFKHDPVERCIRDLISHYVCTQHNLNLSQQIQWAK